MRRKKSDYKETIRLDGRGIDAFSEVLEEWLLDMDIEQQNRLKVRLSLEEALLRMRDRFGEDQVVQTQITTRFRRSVIQITLEGDVFNPLNKAEYEHNDWSGSLLTSVGMTPQYTYTAGTNILRVMIPVERMNPFLKLVCLMAVGFALGLVIKLIFSSGAEQNMLYYFFVPVYDIWVRMLVAVSGPVIFFMVMTTVLNAGAISEQGGSRRTAILRYFLFSLIVGFLVISITMLGLGINPGDESMSTQEIEDFLISVLHVVPENVFSPIISANTPQLLLTSFVLGIALVVAGDKVAQLTRLVKQMNLVGMLLAEWISRLAPYVIAAFVCSRIMENQIGLIRQLPLVILQAVIMALICIAATLLYISRRKEVPVRVLLSKLLPPFVTCFKKGSLDASYGQAEHLSVYELGIQKQFLQASLPNGLVLYMPIDVIGTLLFIVYAAARDDVQMSLFWFFMAIILSVFLFVATPPVQGVNLLAYLAIFSQLGISENVLIEAMVFDIVFGIFSAAANQMMLQMELVLQADRIGLLNKKILRKPFKK